MQVTFDPTNSSEVDAVLRLLGNVVTTADTNAAGKPEPAKKSTVQKTAEQPKPTEAVEEKKQSTPEPNLSTVSTTSPGEQPTAQQVTDATLALSRAGKRAALISLMAKYGVQKASQIEPERWGSYIADATAALEVE